MKIGKPVNNKICDVVVSNIADDALKAVDWSIKLNVYNSFWDRLQEDIWEYIDDCPLSIMGDVIVDRTE